MVRRCAALTLLIFTTGCLWRGYAKIMSVHLEVLTQTAKKLCATVADGEKPTAQGMAEYVYPAQRGREFLRQFSSYDDRPSYQKFLAFLDRYEAMVRDVDAARAVRGDAQGSLPNMKLQCEALHDLAAEVRTQLNKES